MLDKRVRSLNSLPPQDGPVVYWMSRDQRAEDNWGLIYAQLEAIAMKQPLIVVFCWADQFLNATSRHYAFMAKGLLETREQLEELNIPFHIVRGSPEIVIPAYLNRQRAGLLVTDFHVLREGRKWHNTVAGKIKIACHAVDAHNIIPVWEVSSKAEYGAYTIRPKINRMLPDYLLEYPHLERHPYRHFESKPDELTRATLDILNAHCSSSTAAGGSKAGRLQLEQFINERLPVYGRRNDPNVFATSGLSPYLHFGQISAQRVALDVNRLEEENKAEFMEELIVRRELADNFCYYNADYDRVAGFPAWARATLEEHAGDFREYIYTFEELESGVTHDPLWNAAQKEMITFGSMPGYLRMYWAKKILEWSEEVDQAMTTAISLNNSYFTDGRDPNGYTGIAWSIGGVHDRPWGERNIYGKIRYMSFQGAKRKFNVDQYIQRVAERTGEAVPAYSVDKKKEI